jgi:SAM-dependent methyltransferase
MSTLIGKFGHSLRTEGLWRTSVRVAGHLVYLRNRWIDRRFDRRFGTDTSGRIPPDELRLEGEHAGEATCYEPIQVPVFRRIMRDLPIIDYAEYAFVDIGSGKGRAVLMAAKYPFRRVIGVELSPLLHEAALRNVAAFERKHPTRVRIELVRGDALRYPVPAGNVVCFLYNTFGRPATEKLLGNIEAAYATRRRPIFVVYRNPVFADLFERAAFLHAVSSHRAYRIYRTR